MTESVVDIIKRISPDFPVEDLLRLAGGRLWWLPSTRKPDYDAIRAAIKADPSGDIKVLQRRYPQVSREFIYRARRSAA